MVAAALRGAQNGFAAPGATAVGATGDARVARACTSAPALQCCMRLLVMTLMLTLAPLEIQICMQPTRRCRYFWSNPTDVLKWRGMHLFKVRFNTQPTGRLLFVVCLQTVPLSVWPRFCRPSFVTLTLHLPRLIDLMAVPCQIVSCMLSVVLALQLAMMLCWHFSWL